VLGLSNIRIGGLLDINIISNNHFASLHCLVKYPFLEYTSSPNIVTFLTPSVQQNQALSPDLHELKYSPPPVIHSSALDTPFDSLVKVGISLYSDRPYLLLKAIYVRGLLSTLSCELKWTITYMRATNTSLTQSDPLPEHLSLKAHYSLLEFTITD
jgi:hypothetical protein